MELGNHVIQLHHIQLPSEAPKTHFGILWAALKLIFIYYQGVAGKLTGWYSGRVAGKETGLVWPPGGATAIFRSKSCDRGVKLFYGRSMYKSYENKKE